MITRAEALKDIQAERHLAYALAVVEAAVRVSYMAHGAVAQHLAADFADADAKRDVAIDELKVQS